MLKENGRLEPAKNVEMAKLKGKKYKCDVCGKEVVLTNVEFGTTLYCTECGGVLSDNSTDSMTINF
jgi:uncharacterized paraquat-inducible protein A